jgi:hypothetical protein
MHDAILQYIDIVLKSYMYQSYTTMRTLIWLIMYQVIFDKNKYQFSHFQPCFALAAIIIGNYPRNILCKFDFIGFRALNE